MTSCSTGVWFLVQHCPQTQRLHTHTESSPVVNLTVDANGSEYFNIYSQVMSQSSTPSVEPQPKT